MDCSTPNAKRLNLGDGGFAIPGYEGRDIARGDSIFPLPDADGSLDEIRASHVLEHFSHKETFSVLQHWASKLKPGGLLKVAVPDFDWIIKAYQDGSDDKIEGYLMGGQTNCVDRHGAIFNQKKLEELFIAAGIRPIGPWRSEIADCASYPVSLNLQGVKDGSPSAKTVTEIQGVYACMSMPRLAFTENCFTWVQALVPLKIPVQKCTGAFWGQSLNQLFDQREVDGTEFILTIDYDTVFTKQDVTELYRLATENKLDAVCAMQAGRDRDSILMTIQGADGKNRGEVEVDAMMRPLLKIATGHFGLTLIRVSALKKVPRPWFHHVPNAEGKYGEGRIDDDIWFWRQWAKAGLSLHQANRVVVGHLQQVVTWPNRHLGVTHQHLPEWQKAGKPAEAWA